MGQEDRDQALKGRATLDALVIRNIAGLARKRLALGEAEPMVKECFRILRTGGSLIVTTPNLRALTQRWITRQIDDYTFCVNLYGAYMTSEDDRHRWLYTPETLRESLGKCAAWSKLLLFDWRTIEGADIAKDWWICGVEAVK